MFLIKTIRVGMSALVIAASGNLVADTHPQQLDIMISVERVTDVVVKGGSDNVLLKGRYSPGSQFGFTGENDYTVEADKSGTLVISVRGLSEATARSLDGNLGLALGRKYVDGSQGDISIVRLASISDSPSSIRVK